VAATTNYDLRMTDAEGLMWRLEKDPYLSSTFSTVTVLDRQPDVDAFRARMEQATRVVTRLRQRVHASAVNLQAPLWVDDRYGSFSRRHIRPSASVILRS